MKLISTVSIVALIPCLFVARGQISCDKNEVYTTCTSSSCFEETCVDVLYAKPGPKKCTKDCKQGCKCEEGFYRNHDGRCVDEMTCTMCGYQENWIVLYDNTDFELTCYDLEDDDFEGEFGEGFEDGIEDFLSIPPDDFDDNGRDDEDDDGMFGGMCNCATNMYRSIDGLCVSEKSCVECGMNEIYESCGSSSCWEYKCEDVLVPVRERLMKPCTLDCRSGCKCHPGFYRQTSSGDCVTAAACLEQLPPSL